MNIPDDDNFLFCNLEDRAMLESPIPDEFQEKIHEINETIPNFTDTRKMVEYLYEHTTSMVPCDLLAIGFLGEQGRRITLHALITNYDLQVIAEGAIYDIKNTVLLKVMEYKYPLIISDMKQFVEERPHYLLGRMLLDEGIRSAMVCPLQVEDRALGFIFRSSKKPNNFNPMHIKISAELIPRLAQMIEKGYIIDQLSSAINAYMEVLGFVTHELKSPLDSIITLGNTLVDGYVGELTDKQKEYIEKISRKAAWLRELSEEYLNLSRFESGKMEARPTKVSFIDDVIEPSLEILKPQADEKNIIITIKQHDDNRVTCDPGLMRIVFTNLVSNAIKYNEENGRIKISTRLHRTNFIVTVWNTGPGFSREEKRKLFKKFSRIENDELLKRRGSGIGLYTSWKIVQLHNGRIWADSEPGSWAEFGLLLPAKAPSQSAGGVNTMAGDDTHE